MTDLQVIKREEVKSIIERIKRSTFHETIKAIKRYADNHNVSRLTALDRVKYEDLEDE